MHGCGSESTLLVNAEVDSMGGVVDGGVGSDIETSPRQATIEKAQAELRQEYDVREETRRELEFLEKGGNPLDFKFGNAASVSVQSTSLTDNHTEHFLTSEAKGSFALTVSPQGDSVESSGAPTVCEPNCADNFDVENEVLESERNLNHPTRRKNIVPSEQSSQMDGTQNPKELEDSAIFHSYARRNRSRPNHDTARSSSAEVVQTFGGHGFSLPVCGSSKDAKRSASDANNQKDRIIPSVSIPKSTSSNGDVVSHIETSNTQSNMELDVVPAPKAPSNLTKDSLNEDWLNVTDSIVLRDNQHDQPVELDPQTKPMDITTEEQDHVGAKEQPTPAGPEYTPCAGTVKTEDKNSSSQMNWFIDLRRDGNEGENIIAATGTKGLDSGSSCTKKSNNLSLVVNNDKKLCNNIRNDTDNEILMKQTSEFGGMKKSVLDEKGNEEDENKAIDSCSAINDDSNLVHENYSGNGSMVKAEEEMQRITELANEVKCSPKVEGIEQNEHVESEADRKVGNLLGDNSVFNGKIICSGGPKASTNISIQDLPESMLSEKNSFAVDDPQPCSGSDSKLADKAHEDSILEEARIVETKRQRIAELSFGIIPMETRHKSHWGFVLEEMAWLANDFSQERLWKMTAAAQICHLVAFTSRLRVGEQKQHWKLKKVAYTLAKAVMQFWHSAEALLNNDDRHIGVKICKNDLRRLGDELFDDKLREVNKDTRKEFELKNPRKNLAHAIQGYAVRFLKFNSSPAPFVQAEAPATPDRTTDLGTEMSWDDYLTEESLFYAVPSGAMETYRMSIESHLAQCEKTGAIIQEEVDTSMYDPAADFGYRGNAYDEEDGETHTYYKHGDFKGTKSTKHNQKKRNNLTKTYSAGSYELETDLPHGNSIIWSQQNIVMGKRPANNLHVGLFPTKRSRTTSASRQRVISGNGGAGGLQATVKTDASSGDTNSFQDDQSTLHGGYRIQKSMEVESIGDFERQLPCDSAGTSTIPKKKKTKHLGSAYEQGWQLDSSVHSEQRDSSKERKEGLHFDSNGTSGLYGQHTMKKLKMMKETLDGTFDNMAPMSGSIPTPTTCQMSNMSNTNRIIKIITGRDRNRKAKSLKMSAGQLGSGSPWSLFEDQALVVVVHDMGPNWELVSDAINSTLHFKFVFRKPLECKERHKILMDKGAGDGADSADDSGSSQSYPSTLPGIPKGSARQLFQRLQGPMLEDTLKSHFEKIIVIGKKQHYRRNQNDNQDLRQIAAVHNSHVIALSQVFPNNLNGCVLMPPDLCDATASSPDVHSLGYQGSLASGLPMPNQGATASILPISTSNSSLDGSTGVHGDNCASPSGPLNSPVRDGRYNVPRTCLPADKQQQMQHYNQLLSNRNLQQSSLPALNALSGSDCGVQMLPGGGNGVGMLHGIDRTMLLPRPGYQGMVSSPVLNSGSMLSSSMVGIPTAVGMHSGTGTGQGNSMTRPREALHIIRPGHNSEHQGQMMVPKLQMQAMQESSQGIPAFNGLSAGFGNQTTALPVQTYPTQQHQTPAQQSHVSSNPHRPHLQSPNHVMPSQQAYAIRLAKERQMQQRLLQQQQLAATSVLMQHVQSQTQLPTSSSMPNSPQIHPQTSSPPVSMSSSALSSPLNSIAVQQQQKPNLSQHGHNCNTQSGAIGLTNQMGKQQQRQPQKQQLQQSGRHHPQQRQQSQSTQQAKLLKGMGRGNMMVHQNFSMNPSHLNDNSVPPGNQGTEKGEQIMPLMQGQGLYPGTGLSSMQPSKPLISQPLNHFQPYQKVVSHSVPPSKSLQQVPSHSDDGAQRGQVHPASSGYAVANTPQAVPSPIMASNRQHLQSQPQAHQKQVSQNHSTVQRMSQHNHQVNPDLPRKSQTDQSCLDRQPVNNVSQMGTSTTLALPHACNDLANAVPVSSAVASQWKLSELSYETGISTSASRTNSVGSPSLTNLAVREPVVCVTQGLGPRQLSGDLSYHRHNTDLQCQQSQLMQSTMPSTPSQQQIQPKQLSEQEQSPRKQLPLQQQSQQQAHLQSAQGSFYIRPSNSKLE